MPTVAVLLVQQMVVMYVGTCISSAWGWGTCLSGSVSLAVLSYCSIRVEAASCNLQERSNAAADTA